MLNSLLVQMHGSQPVVLVVLVQYSYAHNFSIIRINIGSLAGSISCQVLKLILDNDNWVFL